MVAFAGKSFAVFRLVALLGVVYTDTFIILWVYSGICRRTMQDTKTCTQCGNDSPQYKASDRHRGYYECECGESITVDYYA